ncbi:MAG: hypothetical protein NT127_03590 [Sphingobacteriales bacterium]|nr:hypothetical protein [Sphingobacteriales bacterium]
MKNKLFDDFVKQQMLHIDGEVSDDVWNKIAAKKENKKRFGFWFFNSSNRNFMLIGIVAISIVLGYAIFSKSNSNHNSSSKNIQANNEIILNNIKSQNESQNIQSADSKNIDAETKNIGAAENNHSEFNSNTENNNDTKSNSFSKSSRSNPNLTSKKPKASTQLSNNQNLKDDEVALTKNNVSNSKNNKFKSNAQKKVNIQNAEIDEVLDDADVPLKNKFDFEAALLKKSTPISLKLNAKTLPKLTIPCPDFNNKENKSYLDIYSSVDFINRQFSDSADSIYLKNRNEVTTSQLSFSAGLRYVKEFGTHFNFSAGLNYSQINEQFKFSKGNIIQIIYVTNASGDTVDIYQTESTRYKTTYNKYRTIDLPITLGYGWQKNKWDFIVNAGVVMNIISFYKGDILNSDLQPIAMNASSLSKAYQLKTNIGLGFIGSISIVRQLNNKFSVFTEPYFRYNFSLMNKETTHFKQRFTTTGLRLGIRMNLKNKIQ